MHAGRQVGQEPTDQVERLILGRGEPLDRAVAQMHGRTAELLLRQVLAGAAAHHRRPGGEELADAGHHDRQMRHDQPGRAEADRRSEASRDHRHQRQVVDHGIPGRVNRHVGVAGVVGGLHAAAAAGPVEQPHDRQPQVVRVLLGEDLLGVDRRVSRPAPDREVIGPEQHRPAVDPGRPGDEVGWQHRDEPAFGVVAAEPGQHADLGEAARIGQPVDALAHGEPAGRLAAARSCRDRPSPGPARAVAGSR